MVHMPDRRSCTHDSPFDSPRISESIMATERSYAARASNVPATGGPLMSVSTVASRLSRLGVPIPEPFCGVFSPKMKLAEKSGMYLNNQGSTRGGPYGANSMGPSMGATPSAAVLKDVVVEWDLVSGLLRASPAPSSCPQRSPST